MRPSFAWFAAVCLLGLTVSASAQPAPPAPPANDDCVACHDASAARANGTSMPFDAKAFDASTHGPMACVDCHADLATLAEFPHADKLARVNCASCHDDVGSKYHDSIHAKGRERSGLVVSPACADCHGKHDIKARAEAGSRVAKAQVSATCGACHVGIREKYDAGVHAVALKAGKEQAPTCIDCHSAHSIQRADTDAWRLMVTKECGTCHIESMRTFRDTFHGQVTSLGFVRVATCADCHGAHDIRRETDPRATISKARLVETCRTCHPAANEKFVRYDPHANRHDRSRSAVLYYAGKFMDGLLISVFTFFGVHTTLWLARGVRARRAPGDPGRERTLQDR